MCTSEIGIPNASSSTLRQISGSDITAANINASRIVRSLNFLVSILLSFPKQKNSSGLVYRRKIGSARRTFRQNFIKIARPTHYLDDNKSTYNYLTLKYPKFFIFSNYYHQHLDVFVLDHGPYFFFPFTILYALTFAFDCPIVDPASE